MGKEFGAKLHQSKIFRDYQEAFENATGLPLSLSSPGARLTLRVNASPFCLLMAKSNQACAACYALQRELEKDTGLGPSSLHCFAGLCESIVPVRVGANIIAFLQTGHILLHRPDGKQFRKVAQALLEMGTEVDLKKAEEAWFATTVLNEVQYQSMLRLLHIFAGHLAGYAQRLSLEREAAEPPSVAKAKEVVAGNLDDELSLSRVAKAVNVSAGYFCEVFRKATGMTFTDYVARVRVEKVKNLLANPRLQITAIAYDVGFKSLSQFNRVFKRVCGVSPSAYRQKMMDGVGI